MKKERLNTLVTLSVSVALSVFVISNVTNSTTLTKEVYAEQTLELPVGIEREFNFNNEYSVFDANIQTDVVDGVQVIEFDLQASSYPNLELQVGKPVRLVINADEYSLNSCNYVTTFLDLGFEHQFEVGENIIEFTPEESGEYVYTCWMGMIGANITVVDEDIEPTAYYGENLSLNSCCTY